MLRIISLNRISIDVYYPVAHMIKSVIKKCYNRLLRNPYRNCRAAVGRYIERRYSNRIDVAAVLDNIQPYAYVLTKTEVPYMPEDFPRHYPIGKDMDMVCAEKDFQSITDTIAQLIRGWSFPFEFKEIIKSQNHKCLRIEHWGNLVYQFDVACELDEIDDSFVGEMVKNRKAKMSYYVPCTEDELLLRVYEIIHNPTKRHHIEYVRRHSDQLDKKRIIRYLGENGEKVVEFLSKNTEDFAGGVFAQESQHS